jgi:hypothetical protein
MNNASGSKIDQLIDHAERIGVIGSPSSTSKLSLDILGSAVNKKLIGELALFRYMQDGKRHYALGQITEITLRNIWHEDPTMRSLIRQRGTVDAISERQDTHQGEMTVSAVFAQEAHGHEPSIMGTVPPTGTPIYIIDNKILEELLKPYKRQLFFLGTVYGSTPLLPLWFKHFDSGADGAGEAYHLGIFGKTGSGKSVLAKMILLAYAKHRNMGLFVFDPQGEFSSGLKNQDSPKTMGHILNPTILHSLDKAFHLYDITKIQLDRWELFIGLLRDFGFFQELGIRYSNNQETAADIAETFLRKYTLEAVATDGQIFMDLLDHIRENANRIYSEKTTIERVQSTVFKIKGSLIRNSSTLNLQTHPAKEKWDKTVQFFKSKEGTRTPSSIVRSVLSSDKHAEKPIIILDLSQRPPDIKQSDWEDKIKPLLLDCFIDKLVRCAENAYQEGRSLNTLVVLDEAHRLAPQGKSSNSRMERIKSGLIDAVRTTRKYGLGWMFLSQTLSSLDTEIVQQLRIFFFGFGLSMGTEYQKLRELVGDKESLGLYQRFKDPQSSFDATSREYTFMTIGPVSPLSFSGTPLFLRAFNKVEDFIEANNISIQRRLI